MAHRIETHLESHRRGRTDGDGALTVVGGEGCIYVRGSLSAGRSGWRLSATALRHRRRILLQVVALPAEDHIDYGLEDFAYAASLLHVPVGRYRLRVNHIYYAARLGLPPDALTRGEFSVVVSAVEGALESPPVTVAAG